MHSACGLVFLGIALSSVSRCHGLGPSAGLFEQYMYGVHTVLRQTPRLEVLVLLPLAAIVSFGLYLLAKAGLRYNAKNCKRGGKLRFFLQRVSAVVVLAFIAFHLLTLRNWGPQFAGTEARRRCRFGRRAIPRSGDLRPAPAALGLLPLRRRFCPRSSL